MKKCYTKTFAKTVVKICFREVWEECSGVGLINQARVFQVAATSLTQVMQNGVT